MRKTRGRHPIYLSCLKKNLPQTDPRGKRNFPLKSYAKIVAQSDPLIDPPDLEHRQKSGSLSAADTYADAKGTTNEV